MAFYSCLNKNDHNQDQQEYRCKEIKECNNNFKIDPVIRIAVLQPPLKDNKGDRSQDKGIHQHYLKIVPPEADLQVGNQSADVEIIRNEIQVIGDNRDHFIFREHILL